MYLFMAISKRCFDILYTDPDLRQKVTLSAKGVNIDAKKILLPSTINVEITSKDTLKTTFCLDECIITKNNSPADFFITISDNGCPVPQNRAFRMRVQFEENQNKCRRPAQDNHRKNHQTIRRNSEEKQKKFKIKTECHHKENQKTIIGQS